jgi:uncharacterized protein (TIRG00374 family)
MVVGIAVSAVLLWFALDGVDFSAMQASLTHANFYYVLPVVLLFASHFLLKAMRWAVLLTPISPAPWQHLFTPMMLGYFANNLLPARLGEVIRIVFGARRLGVGKGQILATLLLERIFDFIAVLGFGALAITFSDADSDWLRQSAWVVTAIVGTVLVVALFIVWRTRQFLRLANYPIGLLPAKRRAYVQEKLQELALALSSLRSARLVARLLVNSMLQWALVSGAIYCSLVAVGIDVSIQAAFAVLAATVIAVSLPSAPGFFGSVQFAFAIALQPFGVDQSQAFAASIYYHLINFLGLIVVGVFLLNRIGLSLGALSQTAEREMEKS